jgi:hypothetical protein
MGMDGFGLPYYHGLKPHDGRVASDSPSGMGWVAFDGLKLVTSMAFGWGVYCLCFISTPPSLDCFFYWSIPFALVYLFIVRRACSMVIGIYLDCLGCADFLWHVQIGTCVVLWVTVVIR